MKRIKKITSSLLLTLLILVFATACNNSSNQKGIDSKDSVVVNNVTTLKQNTNDSTAVKSDAPSKTNKTENASNESTVSIYNFHVTNRCPSCIAIEEATTKTLNTYFAAEVKKGRIKRQILNVDDEFNAAVSQKYQIFGSGLIVARLFKGKETTTDLTGDGFKYAKNKEEKFIEILKNKISEYLK